MSGDPKAQAGPEGTRNLAKDAGPDDYRNLSKDADTEGHRRNTVRDDAGPESAKRMQSLVGDDDDTEGHKK
jgi:hypothetical protein